MMSPLPARLLILLLCALPSSAEAATFVVDTTADDPALTDCDDATADDCSLRGALLAANTRPLAETSTVDVPAGTYVLSQSSACTYHHRGNPNAFTTVEKPLCIARNVTLQGAGAATTIIDGNKGDRVLFISADAAVQISGVTITKGNLVNASFGNIGGGGGIHNQGTLTLTESAVTESEASGGGGGGIYNAGTLTLQRSTVSRNSQLPNLGSGGGIQNAAQATLTVTDSTISNNMVETHGAGINNFQGTVTITGTTISDNAGGGLGGGVATFGGNFPAVVTILNSTISGNRSGSRGGGIYNDGSAANSTVHLNNVTITDNTAGFGSGPGGAGGIDNNHVSTLQNTIIAGNRNLGPFGTSPDCGGNASLTSQGYNLIQNTANCSFTGETTGNITGQDPQLGLLVDNGGLTKTHALSDGSPAIDAGNPAAPGSGGTACAATEQRGFLRPVGAACDIGAFERSDAFALTRVLPATGGNIGSVSAVVAGNGFVTGMTVKLVRAGQPDIVGNPAQVDVGGSAIAATFDLVGRVIGPWDVVVMNPDGPSKTLAGGFAIEEGGAPDLWVDVLGRLRRPGRPSRFTILYGNRGNVDAVGVSLSLSVPGGSAPSRFFAITPPPPQPGQVRDDWRQVPMTVLTDAQSGFLNIPHLLPVVPAGFTGLLQIGLTFPPGAPDSHLLVTLGDPIFDPDLDPEVVSDAVAGAQASLQKDGVTVPPAVIADLEQYATNQFQKLVESGRAAFVASLGTQPQVYSVSQLHFDLVFFAAVQTENPQASTQPDTTSDWDSTAHRVFVSLSSRLAPAEAQAQQQNCRADRKPGEVLGDSCSGAGPEPYVPPEVPIPPGCQGSPGKRASNPECRPTDDDCKNLGTHRVIGYTDGTATCVPKDPPKGCPKDPLKLVPGKQCLTFPLRPKNSFDPNDKVGTLGATSGQFLLNATPLSYEIHYENLETATAAAQEVVITDQLDVQTMDLDTFSLGPIAFGGDTTFIPAPGVQHYTGGVDLRPDQNLVVTIQAGLNESTGLVTWRFTSIDPDTGQLTEDPEAGFLPPNVNSPEGEGSVVFTVQPKPGLATGTEIRNHASIVFDTNAPIETPEWLNTIDASAPTSQVDSVDPADCNATDVTVHWSGTDAGSGIGSYSVYVSTDGGPFLPLVADTADTSAPFSGEAGRSYGFYSVARDSVGTLEPPPVAADVVRPVGGCATNDFAVTKISAPKRVTLNAKNPTRIVRVGVKIQNRSPHPETVPDTAVLANLVDLDVTSLAASCPAPAAVLHVGKPQKPLPLTLKSKKTLTVLFDVTIDCANDPLKSSAKSPGHEDYSLHATVHHSALGSGDAHPVDDVCPRQVIPPGVLDPFPDGKLRDKGCGAKKADKTLGAAILVDVVVKP